MRRLIVFFAALFISTAANADIQEFNYEAIFYDGAPVAPRSSKFAPVIDIVCVPEPGDDPATYQISAPPIFPMSVQLTPLMVTLVYGPVFAVATATTTTRFVAAVPMLPEKLRMFPPPPVLSATPPTSV